MMDKLQPVDKTTLQSRVYAALRESIMEGRFQPGDAFTIRALAATMGTSVMPVREALGRLLTEGAVEMQLPSRQVGIPALSREDVSELYRIRLVLERMATTLAARHITDTEIARADGCLANLDHAIETGDEGAFLARNRDFHFTVYRASRSAFLLPMIESLWLKLGPLLRLPTHPNSRVESRLMEGGQEHHHTLLSGLRARDPELACVGLERDLVDAAGWFERNYDPLLYRREKGGSTVMVADA